MKNFSVWSRSRPKKWRLHNTAFNIRLQQTTSLRSLCIVISIVMRKSASMYMRVCEYVRVMYQEIHQLNWISHKTVFRFTVQMTADKVRNIAARKITWTTKHPVPKKNPPWDTYRQNPKCFHALKPGLWIRIYFMWIRIQQFF